MTGFAIGGKFFKVFWTVIIKFEDSTPDVIVSVMSFENIIQLSPSLLQSSRLAKNIGRETIIEPVKIV